MHLSPTLQLTTLMAAVAGNAMAAHVAGPSAKDATIVRSTSGCSDCPEHDCYQCTWGWKDTIEASAGARAFVNALVGFQLLEPAIASSVTNCTVQFPAFKNLRPYSLTITVAQAKSSDWDEMKVDGRNAPESGVYFTSVDVPANTNLGPVDITPACKGADANGQFSIYLSVTTGSFEIWSKDSGNPAVLDVNYE